MQGHCRFACLSEPNAGRRVEAEAGDGEVANAFSPVREYHDICMTFCGITMTRFGAMTRNHDIASQTPPWGP